MGNYISEYTKKELCHPNIIKLYDFDNSNKMLVYEQGIPLKNNLNQIDILFLIKDIASALKYLHDHNLLFSDLKENNIVMKMESRKKFMLCDLETIAVPLSNDNNYELSLKELCSIDKDKPIEYSLDCYTPDYRPFEYTTASASTKYDIYSFGIMLSILLHYYKPIPSISNELLKLKQKYAIPLVIEKIRLGLIPDDLKILLIRMLDFYPDNRPTALEILESETIKNLKEKDRPFIPKNQYIKAVSSNIVNRAIDSARQAVVVVALVVSS